MLFMETCLISRYHPKSNCGVGVQLKHITLRRYHLIKAIGETLIYVQVSTE
jgi:hypothetical protein